MNRRQRRISAKTPAAAPAPASLPTGEERPRPSLVLRVAAKLLLSSWVLRRVQSPQIFTMLRQVAIQAGRADAIRRIDERLSSNL